MSSRTAERADHGTAARPGGRGIDPWWLAAVPLVALAALIAAMLWTGSGAARLAADPGALVRWGLPAAELVHNGALVVVMGALLFAVGVVPTTVDGRRRGTRDRAAALDTFRSGKAPVFLVSLKAGGFGINLTEADYCFLLDPWWNPATEEQAVDRTHRIGQQKKVMVYRLVARDTIEEKVMELKERKARLFTAVLDDDRMFSSALTAEDIRGLLTP